MNWILGGFIFAAVIAVPGWFIADTIINFEDYFMQEDEE